MLLALAVARSCKVHQKMRRRRGKNFGESCCKEFLGMQIGFADTCQRTTPVSGDEAEA